MLSSASGQRGPVEQRQHPARFSWGRMLWPLGIGAALSFFGFIPLMGLPGAVVAEITGSLFGHAATLAKLGPSVWGLAIYVTWIAGAGVPTGCWLLWLVRPKATRTAAFAAGLAGYLLFGATTTLVILKGQTASSSSASASGQAFAD